MSEQSKSEPTKPVPKCAMCGRPATADFRPFCSRRCADADLGRWLTGDYRIPGPALETDEGGVADDEI